MTRTLLILGALAYVAILHVVAILAFFAPHMLPYQGWRLDLPPAEPTAYAAQRHRHVVWLDKHAEAGATILLGASHWEAMDASLLDRPALKYAAGGDTLRNAIKRVALYPNLSKASAIIVWIGFNDTAHRGADEIGADFPKLLDRLPADVPVIALSLAPTNLTEKQPEIAAINAQYQPACAANARCEYLDLWPLLAAPDGSLAPQYDRGDGVHLNQAAYRKLAEAIKPMLPADRLP